MSDSTFDFNVFIKESIDVLVNPKSYFSTMKTTGGMSEPLIKAVIYGAIAGAIAFIWSLLNLGDLYRENYWINYRIIHWCSYIACHFFNL
jgi:hypothetical protein